MLWKKCYLDRATSAGKKKKKKKTSTNLFIRRIVSCPGQLTIEPKKKKFRPSCREDIKIDLAGSEQEPQEVRFVYLRPAAEDQRGGQAAGLLGGLFRVQFLRIFAVLRLAPSRNYAVITRS